MIDLDLRSLAAARIGLGLVLLVDLLIRWTALSAHYTDHGVLPRQSLLQYGWHPNYISLHMLSGEPFWLHLLFGVHALAALGVAVGYRTRLSTFLAWLLLISLHNRNPWLLNGGDVYLRVILFWTLFLPWGRYWSFDAWRGAAGEGRWWQASPEGGRVRSWVGVAVLLQVCLLYWFAALPKTDPSWVGDFTAVEIALRYDQLVTPFGRFVLEAFAPFLPALTKGVLRWEIWGPFLLWFPFDRGQVRTLALLGFAAMHLGFQATMELGVFPAVCVVVLCLLLPAWFWDVPSRSVSKFLERRLPVARESAPAVPPGRLGVVRESLVALLILYTLCWNFSNERFRPALRFPESLDDIGYTLRLDQRWNMFSPSPPYHDGWWVITARRRSGAVLNALRPGEEISWEKPEVVSREFPNQRWRRWMMELASTRSEVLLRSYGRYLCRELNPEGRSLHEVSEIKMNYMVEVTERDGTERTPRKTLLYHHVCFPNVPVAEHDW